MLKKSAKNTHQVAYCFSAIELRLNHLNQPLSCFSITDRVASLFSGSHGIPGESIKTPVFEKILIPQYQRNDVENCIVLSLICQISFSNLPGFNHSFLPVEIGDFLKKAPFKTSTNK